MTGETSPERGFHYSASVHSNGQPIVAGWSYQWITQLDLAPDSWTAPVDVTRIAPTADATTTTIDHVRRLVGLLPAQADVPLFVFDAGYDAIAIGADLADDRVAVLARIRSDRVFYPDPDPDPEPKPGGFGVGRPRRHGDRFALTEPDPWTTPDTELHTHDQRHGDITVQAWTGLHPKLGTRGHWAGHPRPPIVRGTVIRVHVQHLPKHTAGRVKKTLWLWWSGPDQPDLDVCWRAYLRRFDIEHTFRFLKGTLGWTTPALRTRRTSRPLDLADRRRLHPTTPGPPPRRGPSPALGETPRTQQTHPSPSPTRFSPTLRTHRHTSQPTQIGQSRTRTPQRHPKTPQNPLPSHQESRLITAHGSNRKLRVVVEPHGKMPDLVVHLPQRNWLVLLEADTTHGPVDGNRLAELKALFADSTAGLVFVSCFPSRAEMRKHLAQIAWETEVWCADSPTHLVHFNVCGSSALTHDLTTVDD